MESLYFKKSYHDCRHLFLKFCGILDSKKNQLHSDSVKNSKIQELFIDRFEIKKDESKNLLVLISGTHGVEGYTGSAIQSYFLDKLLSKEKYQNYDVTLIHGLNPFGFNFNRRVDENNIDLNRNFTNNHSITNKHYKVLDPFLNPKNIPKNYSVELVSFLFKLVKVVLTTKSSLIKPATLMGQYDYPLGLFFGGEKASVQKTYIDNWVQQTDFKKYKQVDIIDLHTGYGQREELYFFKAQAEIDPVSYSCTGTLYQYLKEIIEHKNLTSTVWEFGTNGNHKPINSILSIFTMILENQCFHNTTNKFLQNKIDKLFLEHYYPSDHKWRNSVLQNTNKHL